MNSIIRKLIAGGCLFLTLAAFAEISTNDGKQITRLEPLQAHTVNLTDHTAVVYYSILDNGDLHVVTTVGPNEGVPGTATQHRRTITTGQAYDLYLDTGVYGKPANVITLSANEEWLFVASR